MKKIFVKFMASALCATLLLTCLISCKKKNAEVSSPTVTPTPDVEIEKPLLPVDGAFLYRNGVSEYSILIRDDANDYETLAARELSQNLLASTGNSIAIVTRSQLKNENRVISLGHTYLWDKNVGKTLSRDDIIDSGYYITTVDHNVYISCPDNTTRSGVLHGVYDFLNDAVGYKFFAKDEIVYNRVKDIPLYKYEEKIVNPSFEMRQLRNADLRDDSLTVMRYRMVYPSETFGMVTWGHGQASQYIHPDHACTCGLTGCGRGITYQEHHPDWFSNYGTDKLQLCWTAGEELERVTAERFIEFFQQYPDAEFFMFGQEDNVSTCDCERCRTAMAEYAYNSAGLQVAFMNNVIERTSAWLEENEPGRQVKYVVYAYYGVEEAPVVVDASGKTVAYSDKVIPTDDLYIFYAPIGANFAFQIDSEKNASVYRNLKDWSVIADGQIIMYLYDINFRSYLVNFNNFGTAKGMYELCKELGVACMTSQAADSYTACFQEMRSYVESSLMWDLSLSYDDLVREFMDAYFKDASEYIYEYYSIIRDRYAYYQNFESPNSGSIYGEINNSTIWTQPVIEKIDENFDKALESIKKYETTDPDLYLKLKNRIMKERLTPIYIKLSTLSIYYSTEEIAQLRADFKYYVNLFKLSEIKEGSDFGELLD